MTGDRVSASLDAASLVAVLRDMGEQAGFTLVLQGTVDHQVSAHFKELPIARALRRIVGSDYALVMLYEPSAPGAPLGRLLEVRVYGDLRGDPAQVTIAPAAVPTPARATGGSPAAGSGTTDAGGPDAYSGPAGLAAVRTLAARGDPAAVAALGRILDTSTDPAVRRAAIEALGGIGGDKAAGAAARGLGDEDPAIRALVVETLGDMEGDRATRTLGQVLFGEPEPDIRLAAVARLRERDSAVARAFLDAAAGDPDPLVRDAALKALGKPP